VKEDQTTRWVRDRRQYFLGRYEDGIAELVRAERHDQLAWVRVLEAVFWWPTHEGKEWPAEVIPAPVRTHDGESAPDAWAHFESVIGIDERYRWEQLPESFDLG
jgi:hypothetical protein